MRPIALAAVALLVVPVQAVFPVGGGPFRHFEGAATYESPYGTLTATECPHPPAQGIVSIDLAPATPAGRLLHFAFQASTCGITRSCTVPPAALWSFGFCPDLSSVLLGVLLDARENGTYRFYARSNALALGAEIPGWYLRGYVRPTDAALLPDVALPPAPAEGTWRGAATLAGHPGYTVTLHVAEGLGDAALEFVLQDSRGIPFLTGSNCFGAGFPETGWTGKCGRTNTYAWTVSSVQDDGSVGLSMASPYGALEGMLPPLAQKP